MVFRRFSLTLFFGLVVFFTSSHCIAQGTTPQSRAVDSLALTLYEKCIVSILRVDSLTPDRVRFSASEEALPVAQALKLQLGAPATLILEHTDARTVETNSDSLRLVVSVQGILAKSSGRFDSVTREFRVTLPSSFTSITMGGSKFVRLMAAPASSVEESTLWSSVLEPALVVLAGAVIVALFFFVRS